MSVNPRLIRLLEISVDRVFSLKSQSISTPEKFSSFRFVGHRGDYDDNRQVKENTIAAFDRCLDAGVWGIEFDIQWTRDAIPVVHHDVHCGRVFNQPSLVIPEVTANQLRKQCPQIPTLSEVVERYGGRLQLMIEIKTETFVPEYCAVLAQVLGNLTPAKEFHILCLDPEIFATLRDFPELSFIPVATTNTKDIFDYTVRSKCAGMAGHYLLLKPKYRQQLARRNQSWGTGFINSRNVAAREINLSTKWLFTDNPVSLQNQLNFAHDR